MKDQTSRTAWGVARLRALHQLRDGGAILPDPFAIPLLGEDIQSLTDRVDSPDVRRVRRFIAARSRIGETFLGDAVGRGVRQVVVLGAGFDTFALRNHDHRIRVFEIDHPATQRHKQTRLRLAGLSVPAGLTFVAVDFERDSLATALRQAGFATEEPAFFLWLGVVAYLTREAIDTTLRVIAGMNDAELVFDYAEPPESYPLPLQTFVAERGRRVAAIGEPWLSQLRPADAAALLESTGFAEWADLDGPSIEAWLTEHGLVMPGRKVASSHLVRACNRRAG